MYKYLQDIKDLKIVYRGGLTTKICLEIYTYAYLTENVKTQKSILGFITILVCCDIYVGNQNNKVKFFKFLQELSILQFQKRQKEMYEFAIF